MSEVGAIKSSPMHLKTMLQKTGHSLKYLAGAEKLDILNMITDRVKESIQLRQKMALTLADLNALLVLEGMPQAEAAMKIVESLLELRRLQLLRLAAYLGPKVSTTTIEEDERFKHVLALIPGEIVQD